MFRSALLAAVLAIGVSAPLSGFAKDVVVSLDQANAIARKAFLDKKYETANQLSYGVLSKRPDDPAALVIAAATDPLLGQPKRGRKAAVRAFRLSKDPKLKFEAAYFAASAATTEERFNTSKYWLRRAYQLAPDDASKARVGQLFKNVARRSPLTVNLNFNITPSSNINNGSRQDTSLLNIAGGSSTDLSADAQALSGWQYSGSAVFTYKLSETARKRTSLNFGAFVRYNSLSSSAKADIKAENDALIAGGMSPRDISASDFNHETIFLGLRQQLVAEDKKSSLSYGLSLGQSWYGGSTLNRYVTGTLSRVQVLSPTRSIQYGLRAQRNFRFDSKLNSSNVLTLNTGLNQRLEGKGLLSFGAYLRDTNSESRQIDNTAIGLTLSYRPEKPVFGKTKLELSMALQRAEYEPNFLFVETRKDNRMSVSSTLTFADINYYGFSPTATFTASRTNSTVGRFNTESLGLNLGLRSSF